MDGKMLAELFAAGAYFECAESGMSEKDAADMASEVCKEAASGRAEYDDEEDTFWSRNKNWLIPTMVGGLAFYLGSEGGQRGRRDFSHLANAGRELGRRLKALFGFGGGNPVEGSIVNTPEPPKPLSYRDSELLAREDMKILYPHIAEWIEKNREQFAREFPHGFGRDAASSNGRAHPFDFRAQGK